MQRRTVIVGSPHAAKARRMQAAQNREPGGLQVMTVERAACMLIGGFAQPIRGDHLFRAVSRALDGMASLGDLDGIRDRPGMVKAFATSFRKVWSAGITFDEFNTRGRDPEVKARLQALAELEQRTAANFPEGMLRPADLAAQAIANIDKAPAVLGNVDFLNITVIDDCWKEFILQLAEQVNVVWDSGCRQTPAWVLVEGSKSDSRLKIVSGRQAVYEPSIDVVSAATPYHEVIEAVRWARRLIASGAAKPQEIAIASATTNDAYNDYFLSMRRNIDLDIHFPHGVKYISTQAGQSAAALADIIANGVSQSRLRRLHSTYDGNSGRDRLRRFIGDLLFHLPKNSTMTRRSSWKDLFDRLEGEGKADLGRINEWRTIIAMFFNDEQDLRLIGESFLDSPEAYEIWQQANIKGPAKALDIYIKEAVLKDYSCDAESSVCWMTAAELAMSPRPYAFLIGLNSRSWPRGGADDGLVPDHVIPKEKLEPVSATEIDTDNFEAILKLTEKQVVVSFARRSYNGRQLGESPLLLHERLRDIEPRHVRRTDIPVHAYGESDRLLAREQEFSRTPQAASAGECWKNWNRRDGELLTPHDGLFRADHPLVAGVLDSVQSASSLQRLIRNPLGYLWHHAFKWRKMQQGQDPLNVDRLDFGNIVHGILEKSLVAIEQAGGFDAADIEKTVRQAVLEVKEDYRRRNSIPPLVIWQRNMAEAERMALRALRATYRTGGRCYAEVPFNRHEEAERELPWDQRRAVKIPGTDINITGFIDRLDVSEDGQFVNVVDYKTGRVPAASFVLNGGKELQRCIYTFAVREMMADVNVTASLLYLQTGKEFPLPDDGAMAKVQDRIAKAMESLRAGKALPGPDAGGDYDDLAIALPAGFAGSYRDSKEERITEALDAFSDIWAEK